MGKRCDDAGVPTHNSCVHQVQSYQTPANYSVLYHIRFTGLQLSIAPFHRVILFCHMLRNVHKTFPKISSQYCSSKSNSSVSTESLHFHLHCIRHSNLFPSIILAVFPSLFFLLTVAGQVPARAGRARYFVV